MLKGIEMEFGRLKSLKNSTFPLAYL